ncbi:hypothetical protein KO481_28100 [Nocardia sp. NEAU-G5]|uniref:Uncharacterized protein n=1 Tax=Nocardia albiluteola TaxID=2842303 RepID=A0ABS6B5I1_9NOCA|nr:hypothetical protein [Nocardia albiluteola]MBU3065378.1 hypothetical protein [Nocardia albiluteola]
MNPEPAEQNSLTGGKRYETLLEMFCASANDVPDLADRTLVSQAADDLIDRISYTATVADFHRAFVRAVSAARLPPMALAAAENHSEATILLFLGRLLAELERRRPWPDPALVQADAEEWPSLGSSLPIAWMELPLPLVQEAVKASFTAASDMERPLLVLRLRTGQLVGLVGEEGPEPSRFLILLPDTEEQQDPSGVIDYLVEYTGLPLETEGIGLSR